jgi:type IV secretion system protein VirD4
MKFLRRLLILTILLLAYSAAIITILWPWAGVGMAIVVVAALARKGVAYTSMGTARWADASEIPHLLNGFGLILGHIAGKPSKWRGVLGLFNWKLSAKHAVQRLLMACQRKPPKHLVRLTNAVHTMVVAPTGVGKGVSCIIPWLLTNPDSTVVVDLAGENYQLTGDARRRMGHRVVRLDPFGVSGPGSDTFNALDSISPDTMLDDARDLAESLVVRGGQEKEPYWNDSAEIWIASIISAVAHFGSGAERSLQYVRDTISNPEKMQGAIEMMCKSDAYDGLLSRIGNKLKHYEGKTLASVLTAIDVQLRFLDTPALVASTSRSSFDFGELRKGKMTVYLILPPDRFRASAGLLRMWIGSALRAVIKGGANESKKVHVIADEAATLGRMEAINDAIDKYRKYGIRLQLYYQSLGQLKTCFPEDQGQTALSNTTQVFFGVNDQQTAEYVSSRLGERTIILHSGGSGDGTSSQHSDDGKGSTSTSHNNNYNWAQHAQKLLKPEQVTALDPRTCITFTPGCPPIWTRLIRYYDWDFKLNSGMGLWRSALDSACLFLTALIIAAIWTGVLYQKLDFPPPEWWGFQPEHFMR